ncbi:MAG: glycosyltransferase family 9 protein [Bryobacteraceae bacterium]
MGDVIHTLPAVASLKHGFPGCHLTWAIEEKWAPLLEGNPFVDRVAVIRRNGPRALLESWRGLRECRYDFAVDFQGLIKSALVASAGRADHIFGYARVRERPAALFYSNRVESRSVHVVDRNLDLAAAAGAGSTVRVFPLPQGTPESPLPEGPFVLACPLAGWRSKQWPIEHYRELAALLPRETGMRLVVDGPPSALDMLPGSPDVFRHFSSVRGLIHATRRAAAFVGGDSGPLHLAAALGKPGVAIFGPTDPARNGPYGDSMTVLRGPCAVTTYKRGAEIDKSMRAVTPAEVLQALKARLEPRPHLAGNAS